MKQSSITLVTHYSLVPGPSHPSICRLQYCTARYKRWAGVRRPGYKASHKELTVVTTFPGRDGTGRDGPVPSRLLISGTARSIVPMQAHTGNEATIYFVSIARACVCVYVRVQIRRSVKAAKWTKTRWRTD